MEKNRKKKYGKRGGFLLAALLSAACAILPVSAEEGTAGGQTTGSICVILKDLETADSSRGKVEFGVWKAGTVSESGAPQIGESYGIPDFPQDGAAVEEAVRRISEQIDKREEEPMRRGRTDEDGKVLFDQLEPGVYLLRAKEDNPYGKVTPVLIQLPYWEEIEGQMEGPFFEVTAEPKASPVPVGPEEDLGTVPGEPPVKTGDETRFSVWGWVSAAAVLILAAAGTGRKRRKRREGRTGK